MKFKIINKAKSVFLAWTSRAKLLMPETIIISKTIFIMYLFLFSLAGISQVSIIAQEVHCYVNFPAESAKPQGILNFSDSSLLISVHEDDLRSIVYELKKSDCKILRSFKMPGEATHTSGITRINKDLLLAVDYNSNLLYVINIENSFKNKFSDVKYKVETGLEGTSGCAFFRWKNKNYLAISEFYHSKKTYILDFDVLEITKNFFKSKVAEYNNGWWSQGIAFKNGFLFESRNTAIGNASIEYRSFDDIINGNLPLVKNIKTNIKGIEDIDFEGSFIWTTDELNNTINLLHLSFIN